MPRKFDAHLNSGDISEEMIATICIPVIPKDLHEIPNLWLLTSGESLSNFLPWQAGLFFTTDVMWPDLEKRPFCMMPIEEYVLHRHHRRLWCIGRNISEKRFTEAWKWFLRMPFFIPVVLIEELIVGLIAMLRSNCWRWKALADRNHRAPIIAALVLVLPSWESLPSASSSLSPTAFVLLLIGTTVLAQGWAPMTRLFIRLLPAFMRFRLRIQLALLSRCG